MNVAFVYLALVGMASHVGCTTSVVDDKPQSGDTLATARVSKASQAEIADLLEKNSADWDRGRIAQLRARRVALTPGKLDGLALQSSASEDCGATGNCFFLIVQEQGKAWRVVLNETAIEGFSITKQTHHGLYDLELSANDSAQTSTLSVMAFDGSVYHFYHCFHVNEGGSTKRRSSIPCPEEGTE
jgi:hypothetical protein